MKQTVIVLPERTATPFVVLPTPVPASLSPNGPWLLVSEGTNYNGPWGVINPVLTNVDGTAWETLNVPRPAGAGPEDYTWWFVDQVPHKPLMLVRGYFSEYFPDVSCGESTFWPAVENPYRDLISIIKLPENEILWQFPLLGAEAKAQIQRDDCFLKEGAGIPSVLGATSLPNRHWWFQNGRFLLFPAAPEGPAADLYIYDTETNTVRRLTTRQNNPDILGWSPDGQTVIYQGIGKIDWYHERVLESSGLYAVSLSGTDRLLFKPKYFPSGAEWLSPSRFVISDGVCDYWVTGECTSRVLLVDLSTGASDVLFGISKTWYSYVADPTRQVLLLIDPPAELPGAKVGKPKLNHIGEDTGRVEGIFQYDFDSRVLHPVMLENLPESITWSQEDQAFILGYDHYDEQGYEFRTFQLMFFKSWQDYRLEERGSINRDWISYSPDKQWSIGKVNEENFIVNQHGRAVQKLMGEGGYWAPDSSALIQLVEIPELQETQFLVYTRDHGWQNTLTRHLTEGYRWWGMWIDPKN